MTRFPPKNGNAEAARSPLENDRPPSYTFDTMAPMHTDSADSPNNRAPSVSVGRDSVMLPDEAESSLTDTGTLGVAETSEVRYSKRPSGSPPHFSFLRFY